MESFAEEITGIEELSSNSFMYKGDEVIAPDTAITLYPFFCKNTLLYIAQKVRYLLLLVYFLPIV